MAARGTPCRDQCARQVLFYVFITTFVRGSGAGESPDGENTSVAARTKCHCRCVPPSPSRFGRPESRHHNKAVSTTTKNHLHGAPGRARGRVLDTLMVPVFFGGHNKVCAQRPKSLLSTAAGAKSSVQKAEIKHIGPTRPGTEALAMAARR